VSSRCRVRVKFNRFQRTCGEGHERRANPPKPEPQLSAPPIAALDIELQHVLGAYKQMLIALFVTTLTIIGRLIVLLVG